MFHILLLSLAGRVCCGELCYHSSVKIPKVIEVPIERAIIEILKVVAVAIEPPFVEPSIVIPVVKTSQVIQVAIEWAIVEMPQVVALAIEPVVKATTILVICPCHPAKSQCQHCRPN